MLMNVLLGLAVLAVLVVLGAYLAPRTVHMERSIVIDASPQALFDLLNGFARFNEWSPWHKQEPEAEYRYSGPATGVGSKMSWVGKKVGSGSQEITAVDPAKRVTVALDFGKQGTATAYYDLEPTGQGTTVTWGFDTDLGNNPVQRYFGLMLERFLGPQYEQGLEDLKSVAEAERSDQSVTGA